MAVFDLYAICCSTSCSDTISQWRSSLHFHIFGESKDFKLLIFWEQLGSNITDAVLIAITVSDTCVITFNNVIFSNYSGVDVSVSCLVVHVSVLVFPILLLHTVTIANQVLFWVRCRYLVQKKKVIKN
jgi:hypothetical protein